MQRLGDLESLQDYGPPPAMPTSALLFMNQAEQAPVRCAVRRSRSVTRPQAVLTAPWYDLLPLAARSKAVELQLEGYSPGTRVPGTARVPVGLPNWGTRVPSTRVENLPRVDLPGYPGMHTEVAWQRTEAQ
eukprot:3062190-Rhodomonas_salina.1